VSFVRASVFGRTRDDEESDGARGGNGTLTGETSDRRTVGPGVVVRDADAKAKVKVRASSRFWTGFIYPFGLDYPFGCERVRSFVIFVVFSAEYAPGDR
jgi:hypothetical protein